MNNIELKVREILKNNAEPVVDMDEVDLNTNLEECGLTSISYIKIVVMLEKEYGIEFDDEQLDFKKLATISSLVDYISGKIEE